MPTTTGVLTEIFRVDWGLDNGRIGQVFQKLLWPGCLSAWHVHPHTTDRLFVNLGLLKIVLYDARAESATRGAVNEFVFGAARPALVVIPPGVWHGVLNTGPEPAALLNLVDHAYCYEAPDHWRLPPDSPEIPFRWGLPSGPPPAVPK